MEPLAAFLGTVLGAALKQCAPVLADILKTSIKEAITDTMEEAKRNPELKNRLHRVIEGVKP